MQQTFNQLFAVCFALYNYIYIAMLCYTLCMNIHCVFMLFNKDQYVLFHPRISTDFAKLTDKIDW